MMRRTWPSWRSVCAASSWTAWSGDNVRITTEYYEKYQSGFDRLRSAKLMINSPSFGWRLMDTCFKNLKPAETQTLIWLMKLMYWSLITDWVSAAKLVPVGYGIKKLQISCVVEDDKVKLFSLFENCLVAYLQCRCLKHLCCSRWAQTSWKRRSPPSKTLFSRWTSQLSTRSKSTY